MKRLLKVLVVLSLTVMILMNMASCKSVLDKTPYLDGPSVSTEVTEPEVTEPEVTEPEVTEPEVTEPEVTEPEVTKPEVTEPEVTEPEVTEPEVTKPEVTEPEVTEPEVTEPEVTEPEVTEPEVTEPEVTEPEVTEPEVTEPATEPEVTSSEPEVTSSEPEVTSSEPEVTDPEVDPDLPKPVENKVTVSIADYATANGWQNEAKYLSIIADKNITITAATPNNGAYTGKYYTNGNNWRIYQTDGGSITITAADGKTIVSVKITYKAEKNGTLLQGNTPVKSGDVVTVNGSSITLSVGNTGTATNGQARITAIEIIYLGEGEAPSCQHTGAEAVRENEVGATCSTTGSYESVVYCSKCGEELSRETQTIDKLDHTPATAVRENEVPASCSKEGSYDLVVYCSVCKTEEISRETKTIDKLDHTPADAIVENEVGATCIATGSYDLVVKCSACGYEISRETKTTEKIAHSLSDWNIVKDSTCKEKGTKTRECTVCDYEETVDIPTKNHNYNDNDICVDCGSVNDGHQHTYESVVTPPTCTAEGYTTHTCACGESYKDNTVPPTHTPAEAVEENKVGATCSKEGSYESVIYCSKCGHEISRTPTTTDKLEHTPAEAVREDKKAPSCTEEGSYDIVVKCTECSYEISRKTETIGVLDHDFETEWTIDKPASCTEDGSKSYHCSQCGEKKDVTVIPSPGHAWGDWTETKAPSCTEEGSKQRECSACPEKETQSVDALDHDFYYGDCTRCDAVYVPATTEEIVFDFGANITTETHKDGKDMGTGKSYSSGDYTLKITDAVKAFYEEYDIKGNSCLKLGSSKATGTFSFTVPNDVTRVIIYAAKYKANASKLTVNGKEYTLSGSSNEGVYDEIIVDTTATKTVTVASADGGIRVMINTIIFVVEKGEAHECEEHSDNKATCSAPARCLICGENVGEALEHTPAEPVREDKKAPSCTEEGSYDLVVKCAECGHEISRESKTIDKLPHTPADAVREDKKAPSCTEEGSYDLVVKCAECGEEISRESKTIDKLPHTPADAVREDKKAPSCTEEGSYDMVVYCSACKTHVISRDTYPIAKAEHDCTETVTQDPTCTKEGQKLIECKNCDYSTTESISIVDHKFDENKICTVCGTTDTGHVHNFNIDVTEVTAPTCTEEGKNTGKCLCGVSGDIAVPALGHDHSAEWTVDVKPTCTTPGSKSRHCLNCSDKVDIIEISKTGHAWDDNCDTDCNNDCGTTREPNHTPGAAATCTTAQICTVCKTELAPATGHTEVKEYKFIDGVLYHVDTCGCVETRETVEADENGIEVATENDIKEVLKAGYNVVLTANIELTSTIEIEGKEVVINLGGYTITADWVDEDGVVEVLWAKGTGTVVTINGEGSMKSGTGSGTNSVVSSTDGAIVNINGGYYYSASYGAVIFTTRNGVVNIYGGKFEAAEQYEGKWYVLDIDERVDPEYFGEINVYGGEFVSYDPVNNTNDGAALANKVADGYHSIKNDNSYVVSKHTPGDEVRENVNDATCSAEGSYESVIYCSACHAELSRETKTLEKADHTPAEAVKENEIPATCTTAGSYDSVVYCSECNYEISRTAQTIEKRPHSEVAHDAQAATCVAAGCEAYVTCENCDYTTYKEIPATGKHTYSYGKCSVCQADFVFVPTTDEITFELGANGSASHNDGSEKTTYTETVDGYTLSLTNGTKFYTGARDLTGNSCIKLGTSSVTGGFSFTVPDDVTSVVIYVAKYKANTTKIQVNGTSYTINGASDNGVYDEIIVDTTATKTVTLTTVSGGVRAMVNTIMFIVETKHVCTSDGLADCTNAARCLVCGEDVGTANGHTNAAAVTENEVGATCSAEGSYDLVVKCSVCGDEISRETKTIDKLPHTESDWIVDVQATETTEGSQHKKCTVCHEVLDTEVIPTLSHECEYTQKVTAPTCTEKGYTTYTCSGCGDSYIDNYVDAKGHTDGETVVENNKAADCVNNGSYDNVVYCSVCGDETSRETIIVDATNKHNYVDYKCSVCGAKDPSAPTWEKVDLANIKSTDIIVIVWTKSGGTYAITNNNGTGSAPTAVAVTISGNQLTGDIADNIKWNISNNNGTLTIHPNGTTSTWLYCTSTNNGVRVGTNTNKTFTIDASSGYLKHDGTSRYLGIYNAQDVRCYTTSTTTNIANQTVSFYKYTVGNAGGSEGGEPVCEHTNTTTKDTATCTAAGTKTITCDDCGETVSTETSTALGHTTNNGTCERCGEEIGGTTPEPDTPTTVTVSKSHTDIAGIAGVGTSGGNVNGKTIKLDNNISIICAQGTAGTAPAIYSESIRLYQNGATLTIKGTGMKTIVITLANNAAGDGPIAVTGGIADNANTPTNYAYTITVNEGVSEVVITTKGTDKNSRLYVANIEVQYEA